MGRVDLYIAGAGGVGRETYDAALVGGVLVAGFLDDRLHGGVVRGLPVAAPEDAPSGHEYVVGIADPTARLRLAELLDEHGLTPVSVVHPRAVIAPETTLGAGCVVLANAYVSSSVQLGDHVQVHYNATVGHDAVLNDRVTVYPGANVSGSVVLGEGVTVGSNAVVLQGRKIGPRTFVGAGAVVTQDLGPDLVVVGSPARPLER